MKVKINLSPELWLLFLLMATCIYVLMIPANSLMNWYTTDDAFYYFKTAQNFSEGYGFSFDRIGRSSGFHPLWMAICIPVFSLARFDLILPLRILAVVALVFTAGSSILIYRILKPLVSPFIAFICVLIFAFSLQVFQTITMRGMESSVTAFFILLLVYLAILNDKNSELSAWRPKLWWVGCAGVLAIFSRLDTVFLAGVIGLWLVIRSSPMRYFVIFDALAAAIAIFIHAYRQLGFGELYAQYLDATLWMVVLSPLIRVSLYYFMGLYGKIRLKSWTQELLWMTGGASLASGILFAMMYGLRIANVIHGFPRSVLAWDAVTGIGLVIAIRLGYRWISHASSLIPEVEKGNNKTQQLRLWVQSSFEYAFPIAVGLGVYMILNRIYFGVWTPVSGQIKHWWGTLITIYGRPTESFLQLFGFRESWMDGAWSMATWLQKSLVNDIFFWLKLDNDALYQNWLEIFSWIGLVFVASIFILFRRKILSNIDRLLLFPLFAGSLVQIIYYTGTRYVNLRSWYWIGQTILIILLTAVVVDPLYRWLTQRIHHAKVIKGIQVLLIMALLINFAGYLLYQMPMVVSEQNQNQYLSSIHALESATQPGDVIGSSGGGVIAYLIKGRTIVNLDGLMNSVEYFHLLKQFRPHDYYQKIAMKYVYASQTVITQSEPYVMIFPDRLVPLGEVGGSMLFLYK